MAYLLPQHLKDKVSDFPEWSHGANRVTLILSDNRKIKNVFIAWGSEIVKIGNKQIKEQDTLRFKISDIKDVVSEV
ncbi:MAG: hypothetical protein GY697_28235 [Desulfobacterales bacterium]|nr:hypothetical protein [Desulfobacterales bacterium]